MDKAQQFLSNTHNMLLRAQRDAEIQGSHYWDESNTLTDKISCLKEDVSCYHIKRDEHCSENDQLKGKLSALNSALPPPPPCTPLPSAACKAAPPSASHEADKLYDVLMDISPIKEALVAALTTSTVAKVSTIVRVPPVVKASAIALSKCPTVDELPSAHPQKMQSLVTAMSSSCISAVSKTYSTVVASLSGKSSSQKDETTYTLLPQFAPMGIAITGSKCLPHGLPPYDKEKPWEKAQHVGSSFHEHILNKDAAKALLAFDSQNNSLWTQVYQSAIVPPPQADLPPLGLKLEGFLWSDECTPAIAGPLHVDVPSEKDISIMVLMTVTDMMKVSKL
ncbi:hypothetical protein DACRYDRAFT_112020 [Dacryopinax primogenitus]|uniref:Uncharacterized protein n=1 Tax=Dacryopinax primogenitus (strain DJM 731) TaxID=1858805 RepID=M5FN95_DACPD|nr:uncharacterized protein DACRYDRAFT_112020 [Dacryopinax primogenitus]EJT97055.1 hypothetical protein DACRYDRAFT_112020 [Dacryopinax primogenitus]